MKRQSSSNFDDPGSGSILIFEPDQPLQERLGEAEKQTRRIEGVPVGLSDSLSI